MSTPLRRRLREAVPSAVLAATIFVPLLLTRPGRVGADTKSYLYLDPGRLLERAGSMWDPSIGMGTVTHQNVGYLWPIGPYYWLADAIALPDWVAQRLWLGAIMFAAGLGVRFMLKAMGQVGPHVTAATFCYALTPYVLTLGARLSVILLPYAGLPWLIGLTVLSLRRQRWREPALFALVVASIGSVNATALILCGMGPVLWVLHEVVVTRDVRLRDALRATGRIGVVTVGCSLWWLAGLWAQRGWGIEILRYTETAETVAAGSVSLEVLRGLGYWFFYGEDRYGPWIAPSRSYMTSIALPLSFVLPWLGLVGAAVARFRERVFFAVVLAIGLFLSVGAHPWDSGPPAVAGVQAFLESDAGLAMRSLPRAAPLVVLALAVFLGALIAAVSAERERWARPLTAGAMAIAVLALPPLWRGQMVDRNLDRAEDIPSYWDEAAAALDDRGDATRVLGVPGSDFASYRWGTTVDPVLPGLMDRPYVARELIPYGSPPSADLLNALDHRLQEQTFDPAALTPMARFMGVGDVSVRSDLSYERYNTPRPRPLWDLLSHAPGVASVDGFGPAAPNRPRPELPLLDEAELAIDPSVPDPPEVGVLGIDDPEPIIRTAPTQGPVILAGSGDGLVDAASAGLLSGHELVLYSASFAGDAPALRRQVDQDAVLVLTDTNRREGRRWGTVRDTTGIVERPGQEPLVTDFKDQRLDVFDLEDQDLGGDTEAVRGDTATVRDSRGGVWARATSYGNAVSLTPEDDPVNAVDGDLSTAWRTGGFSAADGEALELHYRRPVTTDQVRVLQAFGGVRSRTIDEVDVSFDGGPATRYQLDDASLEEDPDPLSSPGQVLRFDDRTFSTMTVTIASTDPGNLRRYDGISAVGFSEVTVTDRDGTQPVADDVVRLPVDLLGAAGKVSDDNALAVVLTRQRVAGTVAVRSDPERAIIRSFDLPSDRSFSLSGQVRLSNRAVADNIIDTALGRPDATDGGVTATSSRRIPGGLANGASAAIDGDPDTWWSPGFLAQQGEALDYVTAKPQRVDRLRLQVLTDGRHSVPRTLEVTVDDGESAGTTQEVALPDLVDQDRPNAAQTVEVALPEPATGTHIRVAVADRPEAVRDVETIDWFTGRPVTLPMGIAELGIEGLSVGPPSARVDDRCRSDLVQVDGTPVAVSLRGSTEDLLAGRSIDVVGCSRDVVDDPAVDEPLTTDPLGGDPADAGPASDGSDLALGAGTRTLRTTGGAFTGFDLDRLVLRSAPGGDADPALGTLERPSAPSPRLTVSAQGRTSADLTVTDAEDPFWLVLGQSHNDGWTATVDGHNLGPPTLVDGYANGWEVPAGANVQIHLEWTPQRVVRIAFVLSVISVLLALVLIAWPRWTGANAERHAAGAGVGADGDGDGQRVPLDSRPSMPRPLRMGRVLRYAGPSPSRFALLATTLGALVLGGVAIGIVPGLVLGAVALLALRVPRARPLLTFGGPLLLAGTVAFMVIRQATERYPEGFDWPGYFEVVHQPAWTAVGLIVLDAVVDRCWLRRWWPTDDSPS